MATVRPWEPREVCHGGERCERSVFNVFASPLCLCGLSFAAGEHGLMDDIAAIQVYVKSSDAVSVAYAPTAAAADGSVSEGFTKSPSVVTHANVLRVADSSRAALGLTSTDVVTVTAPLSLRTAFAAGAVAATQAHAKLGEYGGSSCCHISPAFLLLPLAGTPHSLPCCRFAAVFPTAVFHAPSVLEAIAQQRSTVLVATRKQVESLAAAASAGSYDLSSLRTGLIGTSCGPYVSRNHFHLRSYPPTPSYRLAVDSPDGDAFNGLSLHGLKVIKE
jgi:acyl-CoA synthetase (AMP-forming)/AMP-acid ligase II